MKPRRAMSSTDIDRYYAKNPRYGGWASKDQLALKFGKPIPRKFFIINMQDAFAGPGTHWVAIYNVKPHVCIYIDSFGLPPDPVILTYMRTSRKTCVASDVQIQHSDSEACGYYTLDIIDQLEKGKSLAEIVLVRYSFDTLQNEKLISKRHFHKLDGTLDNKEGSGIPEARRYIKLRFKQLTDALRQGPRNHAPPQLRSFQSRKGSQGIFRLTVCRAPIWSSIDKALNLVSLGSWGKVKERLNYKDMFHLYLLLQLDDQTLWRIEKNEVITVFRVQKTPSSEETECVNVPYPNHKPGSLTVDTLLSNGFKAHGDTLWIYDPKNANCQVFAQQMLRGNGLLTTELNDFIKQDAVTLFEQMPQYVHTVSKAVTDTAGTLNRLYFGEGLV